jgi:hypothetical protein
MARGFESKDVEFQQEEASRTKRALPASTPAEREARARRDLLALALSEARAELERATRPAHRQMLQQKIEAVEQQLRVV